jgi:hypothetical protein
MASFMSVYGVYELTEEIVVLCSSQLWHESTTSSKLSPDTTQSVLE